MQFITVLTGIIACLSATASAQYSNQSHPFNLILESSNKTLNGIPLSACHSGAAIESLCTYPVSPKNTAAQFYYNYTTYNGDTSGILTWNLIGAGDIFLINEPMRFDFNLASNIAMPLFFPDDKDEIGIAFDKNNYLNVLANQDDTVVPPKYKPLSLSRWQICTTTYGDYTYQTLVWVLGNGKPQNPSCQAVKVKRTAIPK